MAVENSSSALERLQAWYHSNCDGDWEHQYGFSLETLDNPGWIVTVDLTDTHQENLPFSTVHIGDDRQPAWINVKKHGSKLHGACGSMQLNEMLEILASWLQLRPQ